MDKYKTDDIIKRWDIHAEEYASYCSKYGDRNKEVLLTPTFLKMTGDVSSKKVLDAGCGEGFLSRLLAERGASVTAVDYSKELVEIARKRTQEGINIDYRHENLEHLNSLINDFFHMVVSCCAVQDVLDYKSAIKELSRVLKTGGTFILAIPHPCFSSDGSWGRDTDNKKLYWKTDNYFFEREYNFWAKTRENNPITFHRTITSYFKTLTEAGFLLQELIEPFPSKESIEKYPNFKDDLRMSHFLILKLIKNS
ncbi:MAG: class I SAM-dependent methyltransferase [bacterium]|nr:class I SAM-dependent methyltransferase [bacterium]